MFGFPSFVRFSWGTAKRIIKARGVNARFAADDDEEEEEEAASAAAAAARGGKENVRPEKKRPRDQARLNFGGTDAGGASAGGAGAGGGACRTVPPLSRFLAKRGLARVTAF